MNDPAAATAPRWREPLVLVVAWLLLAWGCAEVAARTQGTYDTYRDLWFAQAIAHGIEFPHTGPVINQTFHLGPLWFWLLALVSLVLPGAKAAYWLTGLVVAARFPLAWLAGRALHSRALGAWFVAFMAFPGWWTWQLVAVTHTSATECAVLLLLIATVNAWRAPSWPRTFATGAAIAFALHAHPSTLSLAGIAAAAVAWRAWRVRRPALVLALAVVPLLAFAPYLSSADFTRDLGSIASYSQSLLAPQAPPLRYASLVASTLFGGALFASYAWFALDFGWAWALAALPWALGVVAMVASLRAGLPPPLRRIALAAFALFLAQCAFLVLIRPISPFWMTFALFPLLALGAAALAAAPRRASVAQAGALGACAFAVTAIGLALLVRFEDELWWPSYPEGSGGAMTVTAWPDGRVRAIVPAYGLRDVDALMPAGCDALALHGPLAVVADRTLGYTWLAACGGHDHVKLGGAPGAQDRFAAWSPALARACGISSRALIAAQARIPFTVRSTADAVPLGDPHRYPPRSIDPQSADHVLELSGVRHRFVAITDVLPDYVPMTVGEAQVAGAAVERLKSPGAWALFDCRDCAGGARDWTIPVTGDARYVDVVEFDCPVGE